MKRSSPEKKVVILFACLLAGFAAVSCGSGTVSQTETPRTEIEEKQPVEKAAQPPAQPAGSPGDVIFYEDLVYPGSEFLFEVPGFGGPMMPWRFYLLRNVSSTDAADFYRERLSMFNVETDEVVDGHQQLSLTYSAPMEQLGGQTDAVKLAEIGADINHALVGVEVVNSSISSGFSRLFIARETSEETAAIPKNATIVVLEYFTNPY